MTTNVDITNRALAEIGSRSKITSMVDGSTEALYANLLYNDLRDFMLRQGDYDFALAEASVGANTPGPPGWNYSYDFPGGAVRIRNLVPTAFVALNPIPVEFTVAQPTPNTKKILTQVPIQAIYYTCQAVEDTWDAMFTEAFVRMLGSSLAFALQNRIEASKEKLNEALSFAGIANLRDG